MTAMSTLNKLFVLISKSRVFKLPKPKTSLLLESATSLARKIRQRELTSLNIVCTFIDRIWEVNPVLNAVVDQRFIDAIKEAEKIDREIATGTITDEDFQKQPFLGVPFTTKESISAQGLSNTFGLVSRKSQKATFDAKVVQLMKNAGGILLGVTNIPQMSAWHDTRNPIYGVTNNPYDVRRTAGGSSGGEASIVAACGSPFGIGSDLGGSLRNPAFMCGLFAHKPTTGLLSVQGVMFNTVEKTDTIATTGPLTRHSEDLLPILKVLVEKKRIDLDDVDIKTVKVFYVLDPQDPLVGSIGQEMKKEMLKVVQHFEDISDYKPRLLNIPELRYGGRLWRYWINQEPNVNLRRDMANREFEVRRVPEIVKFLLRRSEFDTSLILALLADFLPGENPKWAQNTTTTLHNKLTEILGNNGVLLYPSAPQPAGYHHLTTFRVFQSNLFTVWNALKFCVTQVPLGLSQSGVPTGIQVVGAPFQDRLTIAVARELEKKFGGYVPP